MFFFYKQEQKLGGEKKIIHRSRNPFSAIYPIQGREDGEGGWNKGNTHLITFKLLHTHSVIFAATDKI